MTGSADSGSVHFAVEGPVARITFDRPAARNAMTWRMYEDLAAACTALRSNAAVRVAVLRGAGGKAFIAGTDIEQFSSFKSGDDGIAYEKQVDAYVGQLQDLPIPTIAVIEGWAVGGGLALANACDIRIATTGARFGVPIARTLGNCLSAANLRRLSAKLGVSQVSRMLLLAEMPTAEDLPDGYVTSVTPDDLERQVAALCQQVASHAPLTLRATKEALRRVAENPLAPDDDLIRMVYGSADFREGVAAFMAKRSPQWQGQ